MRKRGKKMLSVKDVAERVNAAPSTVRYWLTQKRFPNAELIMPEVGTDYWLIPESDIIGLEKSKPGPKPKPSKKGKGKK
jgi:hypothetical protein